MTYRLEFDVGTIDFAITRAVEELSRERDAFGASDIAELIGCSEVTVKRTLPRLRSAGMIKRMPGRNGYRYRYEFVREKYATARK